MDSIQYLNISARKYYDYLKRKNKSRIEIPILSVKKYKDNYIIYTSKSLKSGSEIGRLEILGKIYSEDTFKFVYTDDIKKRYAIATKNEDLISALSQANENNAFFVSDLSFLVKRVIQWSSSGNHVLRCPDMHARSIDPLELVGGSPSQIKAVDGVLQNPITYVWGAPGTGKTRFVLARCIPEFIKLKKRIVITAPTNNALEQTLRGVIEVLEDKGIDYRDFIFRAGVASYEFSRQYPEICENIYAGAVVGKLKQDIEYAKKLLVLERDMDTALQVIDKIHNFQRDVQDLIAEKEGDFFSNTEAAYFDLEFEYKAAKERYYLAEQDVDAVNRLISYYTKKWFVRKKRKLIEDLTEERNIKSQIKEKALLEYREAEEKKNTYEKLLKDICLSFQIKQSILEVNISNIEKKYISAVRKYEHTLKQISEIKEVLGKDSSAEEIISSCEEQIKEIEGDTAKNKYENTMIIALTVDRLIADFDAIPWVGKKRISHIFLDECGICPLAKAIPLFATGVPVAMFGDHMQLPPVCEMNDEDISLGDNSKIFMWSQTAMFAPALLKYSPADLYEQWLNKSTDFKCLEQFDLTDSFRFGHELASVLAGKVYSPEFRGNSQKSTKIILIDAGRKQIGSKKRTSISEVNAIKFYIQKKKIGDNFAIITPYKNQIEELKQALKQTCDEDCIYTVHAAQGREWKRVFFSVVDCGDMYFTNSEIPIGLRVINTALSRAIDELIVVCDYEFWSKNYLCEKQLISQLAKKAKVLYKAQHCPP